MRSDEVETGGGGSEGQGCRCVLARRDNFPGGQGLGFRAQEQGRWLWGGFRGTVVLGIEGMSEAGRRSQTFLWRSEN